MRKFDTRQITLAAAVAALYALLTYSGSIFGLTYGPVQFRFAEALCVLPFLFPTAAPGLFVGCLIANLLSPYGLVDVVCGSAATLIAALITARVRHRWLAPLPAVLSNGVIIGAMLAWYEAGFGPGFWGMFAYNGLAVALGELGACYVLGMLLLYAIPKIKYFQPMLRRVRC
ncbi:QueT transporter family protein [Flavonifractor sp. DFI.6.63]|uniref:QueT transporter family protein n=1 Tax=Flavonifractor sp. DFI.6.63 TaxID=2963704 RepID=UPI00210D33D2|nr:QueT transporter family protein [Flavonifractor sp. DFI.6.63]MCQ5030245.1 QueT transporter family protein [Flavonifractor sp. DFI.6.63]